MERSALRAEINRTLWIAVAVVVIGFAAVFVLRESDRQRARGAAVEQAHAQSLILLDEIERQRQIDERERAPSAP